MRGLRVSVNPEANGSTPVSNTSLGVLSGRECHRTALLHLAHMGAGIVRDPSAV